jgi:hypothetical protein
MRIDALRSAVEAAGVAMAPNDDQFDDCSTTLVEEAETAHLASWPVAARTYVRSWAAPVPATGLIQWFTVRRPRTLST